MLCCKWLTCRRPTEKARSASTEEAEDNHPISNDKWKYKGSHYQGYYNNQ